MGRNLVRLVEHYRATGGQTDPGLSRWVAELPRRLQEKLVGIGLLSADRTLTVQSLSVHLQAWATALHAKGNSPYQVEVVTGRAKRIIDGCKFRFYSDINACKVQTHLHELREGTKQKKGISAQTFNFYLEAIKQLCRWMIKDRRAIENPVAHLDGLNVRTDRRRDRRALTSDELQTLLTVAREGPERFGMTGEARFML